jgi:hypothetical protein
MTIALNNLYLCHLQIVSKHKYVGFPIHMVKELFMNKQTYLALALMTCIASISSPLWADVVPAPEQHPANIKAPATSTEDHTAAAKLHKEHAAHHQAMAEHHKSVAADYAKDGQKDLAKHHQELAKHHDALAKEHEQTAKTHEAKATTPK